MDKITQLFQSDATTLVPTHLNEGIYARIEATAARASKRARLFSLISAVAFLAAMIISGQTAIATLGTSGFNGFASLIFSDTQSVLAAWQSFGLSLIESFPMIEVGMFLGAVAAFLFSVRIFTRGSFTNRMSITTAAVA